MECGPGILVKIEENLMRDMPATLGQYMAGGILLLNTSVACLKRFAMMG